MTELLKHWFFEHIRHPYPTEEERQLLAEQTGLTEMQLTHWCAITI